MMIALDCPGCGKRYEVDGALAGKKSRCKDCGNVFRIPAPVPVAEVRAEVIAAEPAVIPAPAIVPLGVDRGTIVLNCPRCLKRYEVYASLAGKKSRCKDCKEVFTIPAPMGRPVAMPSERPAPPKAPSLGQTYWDADIDPAPSPPPPRKANRLPPVSSFEDEPLAPPPPRATYPKRAGRSERREEVDSEVGLTVAGWYCALAILAFIVLAIWHGVSEPDSMSLKRAFGAGFILLYVLGFLMSAWGSIWLLVIAFRDKVEKGIFCLIVPCYAIFYMISRWRETRGIFALSMAPGIISVGFMMFGALVLGIGNGTAIPGAIRDRLEAVVPTPQVPEANLQEVKLAAQSFHEYIRAINRVTNELSVIRETGLQPNAPGVGPWSAMSLRNSFQQLRFAENRAQSRNLGKNELIALKHAIGEQLRTALTALKNEMQRIESFPGMQGTFEDAPSLIDNEVALWTLQPGEEVRPNLVDRPNDSGFQPDTPQHAPGDPGPGIRGFGRGNRMPSIEDHFASLRNQHGDKAVMLVLSGLPVNADPANGVTNRDVSAAIDRRLTEIAPGARQSMSMGSGDKRSICIAPVDDLPGFVRAIDFGKATARGSRVEVALSSQYIASVTRLPAEPAIAAQDPRTHRAEAETPADADPITASMIQLKSPEVHRKKEGIQRIRRTAPNDRLEEVVAALLPLLDHDDGFMVNDVIQTLEIWRSPQAVPKLIERANDDRFFIRKQAIKTLGKYKDPRAAEPIAAHLKEDGFEAEDALKAIGPAAEPALIERLTDPDTEIRRRACEILKYVGGTETLRAMKALPADPEFSVRIAATEAMKQIIRRVGPLKDSPGAKKSAKRPSAK